MSATPDTRTTGTSTGTTGTSTDDVRADDAQVELLIGGMTCASCAMRIEKKLNKLDGVTATVNYATEKARASVPAGTDPAQLVAAVEAAGYTASLPEPPADDVRDDGATEDDRVGVHVGPCGSAW